MNLPPFQLKHIWPLFVGIVPGVLGITYPVLNVRAAVIEYGFPARIADSKEVQAVWITQSIRTSALSVLMLVFYSQGKLAEIDTIFTIMGPWLGMVDGYMILKEGGNKRMGWFKFAVGVFMTAWGWSGFTAS